MNIESEKNSPAAKQQRYLGGSLYQWILLSFVIAIIPLAAVIIDSVLEVADYNQKSQQSLFRTVKSTESSRNILDRLIAMERSIRQYQVLNEPELLQTYQEHRNKFVAASEPLLAFPMDSVTANPFGKLIAHEKQLHQLILSKLDDNQSALSADDLTSFDNLTALARALIEEGENRVAKEAGILSEIAQGVQQRLMYSALASIPVALLLGLILVHLITRPINDIGLAIHNLGDDGFEQRIAIKGPKDLTRIGQDLEWLRQKLNRLEFEKQQFIRNVSHELKTPLATLKEGTDLLAENVVGELNTEQQEIIQLMTLSTLSLHDLIENLLEYQRALSNQVVLNFSHFNLKNLIERVVNESRLSLRSKHLQLSLQMQSINLLADREKIKVIIGNVLSNALKFSPRHGTIAITLTELDTGIELTIEDQGPGIAEDIQHRIYQDFFQGDVPDTWTIKGSGLGLALVKHYLREHRGSIELLAPNQQFCGARFKLQLPKTSASDAANHH